MSSIDDSLLGKDTQYDSPYDPDLLYPIARAENRAKLDSGVAKFTGEDWWTSYELSWLNDRGLPQVALGHFRIPADSPNIIESKSFKLYLNSFNHHRCDSWASLRDILIRDLSLAAGSEVKVEIESLEAGSFVVSEGDLASRCIDGQECDDRSFVYQPDSGLLRCDSSQVVQEQLHSHLLRSNCPVTGQPDWGSVYISYRGPKIEAESLLRYVVSFRQCQDFHEHCVERMFCDLLAQCQCESLSVYARYTRRGGLDINPYRATPDMDSRAPWMRTIRQ